LKLYCMQKIVLTGIAIILFTCNIAAQKDSAAKAKQLLRIEQALMNALPGDTSLWSRYLDPHWYIVTEDGTGLGKEDFLKGFSPFPKGYSGTIKVINPVFTFHGNIAVVHYVADENEEIFGQHLHTSYGTANTWYRAEGPADTLWMMIGSQIFEIPQLPVALKVAPQVLRQYAGTYTLADRTAVVTFRNDSLFLQRGNSAAEPLYAETANVFFRKSDTRGRKIFIKNEAGDVLMLERRNGADLFWKRK
jgi:hypothetical protein